MHAIRNYRVRAPGSAPVLCEVIGEPIKQLAQLIGEPIKLTGQRALRKALVWALATPAQPSEALKGCGTEPPQTLNIL